MGLKDATRKRPEKKTEIPVKDEGVQINFRVPYEYAREFKKRIRIAAASTEMDMKEYLRLAVEEKLNRDGF